MGAVCHNARTVDNVGNLIDAQLYVPKPDLNIDLRQELELKLRKCIGKNVILRYWSDGYEFQEECIIEDIDDHVNIVTVRKHDELMFIQFEKIFEVSRYDYLDELY